MTTIAYREGVMAADMMMTRGNEPVYGVQKVFKTAHFLVGMSGSFANAHPFLSMFREWEAPHNDPSQMWSIWDDAPDYGSGFCALIVNEYGDMWSCIDSPPVRIPAEFDAIGSGGPFAMGAMGMGASAAEAVRIAKRFDVNTGGNTTKVSFDG